MVKRYQLLSKICLVLGMGVLSVPALADPEENAVKMVTYFPVPYAVYNAIFVNQKFDVGTSSSTDFTLNLGDTSCTDASTNAKPSLATTSGGDVRLKYITNSSALSFNTDIYTPTATFGAEVTDNANTLIFKNNLYVDSLAADASYPLQTLTGTQVKVSGKVNMILDVFSSGDSSLPSCDSVTWQKFLLGTDSNEHYFLTCGTPEVCVRSLNASAVQLCESSDGTWHADATSANQCCTCTAPATLVDGQCSTGLKWQCEFASSTGEAGQYVCADTVSDGSPCPSQGAKVSTPCLGEPPYSQLPQICTCVAS